MEIDDQDVSQVLNETQRRYDDRRVTWRRHRAAYKTDFWSENQWNRLFTADDGLPIKIQVNQIQPFVSAQISNLFYRQPRTTASLPNVWETGPGRPKSVEDFPDIVTGYLDEWLVRSGMQRVSTYAYQLALMYDASAFKIGIDLKKKGDMVSRSWVQALPRWECLWDEEAETPDQQAYRGHLRWERVDRVEELLGVDLPDDIKPQAMTDFLEQETTPREGRLKKYVKLLEFYDLLAGEQRFYVVDGTTTGSLRARPVGEVGPIPYTFPDGSPGIPLVPVVLTNVPEYPMQGVAAVARLYELNAERNLMLTLLANSVRRRAGLALLHKKLESPVIAALQRGRDLELIEVEGEGSLENKIHALQLPPMDSSLPEYVGMLQQAWSDTQGAADLQQGKQLKYASASEANLLAGYGEAASGDLQQRMVFAISECARLELVMTAEHMGKAGVTVRVEGRPEQLTKEICRMPWTIGIVDSAATPVRDMRKRDSFEKAQPTLLELTKISAGGNGEDGQPMPAELVKAAQEQLNYMVQLYGLPESMSWDALGQVAGDPEEEKAAKVKKLIETRLPELQGGAVPQAAQVTPGVVPAGNEQVAPPALPEEG